MAHQASAEDLVFRRRFKAGLISPADFDHHAHLRLAYIYLCEMSLPTATTAFRTALIGFLKHHEVNEATYHHTLTVSWMQAVYKFSNQAPCTSFEQYLSHAPQLLDENAMLTHYNRDRLFSKKARQSFVAPDLEPIIKPT